MYITYFKYTNYPKRNIQKTKEAIKNIVAKKESRHNKGTKLETNNIKIGGKFQGMWK